jgi:hypothetical protein
MIDTEGEITDFLKNAREYMSEIFVKSERIVNARPEEVYAQLIDYRQRPKILTQNFLDYAVEQGGQGGGTVASYRLAAGGRERPYRMQVEESEKGHIITERDTNSSLVTTWTLQGINGGQQTRVILATTWSGGSGVGGFFERTFAPVGLRRIYAEMLNKLAQAVEAPAARNA